MSKRWIQASLLALLLGFLFWVLPVAQFSKPYSTVVEDRDGHLLSAAIAPDGQWRFPASETLPSKFETCILHFEDQHFYCHFGFNPISLAKAFCHNLSSKKSRRGGSTITMQTIRLARDNPERTWLEKGWEILLAMRLESACSKQHILQLYGAHAPFGGNVVGLEAASWRYFGRQPQQLSWAESALLAVLPNSPSLIRPGKNQDLLLKKRNRLLKKLFHSKAIDNSTYHLALLEPIPQAPKPLPRYAPHLLARFVDEGKEGARINSTLQLATQQMATGHLEIFHKRLVGNSIHNGAVLIMEVATGKVLAYVGNTQGNDPSLGHEVDIVTSPRSYGSLLKPLLYAALLEKGTILPNMLVADIPTNITGYSPQNFFKHYDGAVPVSEALSRSLNIPFVRLLHEYGTPKFYDILKKSGVQSLNKSANHYGLSVILGGGESTLWELTGLYASMARSVLKQKISFAPPLLLVNNVQPPVIQPPLSPASLYFTLQALTESKRPGNEGQWLEFASSQKIYWKTGTSFGSRDAWAIGVTTKYAVGVWLGNASGEGRAGLTGVGTAAPLLFDLFAHLVKSTPLPMPSKETTTLAVCRKSGYKAQAHCPETDMKLMPQKAQNTPPCPYHQIVHLDKSGQCRASSACEEIGQLQKQTWFVLPTIQEWYYKPKHPDYRPLPPWKKACQPIEDPRNPISILYPRPKSKIYIPLEINNKLGKLVLEAAHGRPNSTLYWHVDNTFITETTNPHQVSIQLPQGWHSLTVMDENGSTQSLRFEILERGK
jgi:penicillin-binding protein 1C